METSMVSLRSMGFSDKDLDDIKGIFEDTNMYLLLITVIVASTHVCIPLFFLLLEAYTVKPRYNELVGTGNKLHYTGDYVILEIRPVQKITLGRTILRYTGNFVITGFYCN